VENARLYRAAERKAEEEAALREATVAVSASFGIEEVVRQIAENALKATNADGAYVSRIDVEPGELVVAATAGEVGPPLDARVPYAGSIAEWVLRRQEPLRLRRLHEAERPVMGGLDRACPDCSGVWIPLSDGGEEIGVLVLLRSPDKTPFRGDEVRRAHTFGHLASLAFRRIHLLEDSERKREELQRLMQSRERLIRGFSHDVKNPLGAADGFVYLFEIGALGELTEKQKDGIVRLRRSIRSALRLIDDLLDLARSEAGQLWSGPSPWTCAMRRASWRASTGRRPRPRGSPWRWRCRPTSR
jgi:signal transduction histidine kinase